MIGRLVHGDNHFIVLGQLPQLEQAVALFRHWALIQIGAEVGKSRTRSSNGRVVSKAFRENLEWAVVVPGNGENSPAVTQLLEELPARGVHLQDSGHEDW